MKKVVDERQELELLKIERTGFWVIWSILLLSIITQLLFQGKRPDELAGENIAFFVGCITIIVGCMRKGVWCYTSKPTVKNYLLASLAGSILFTFILGAILMKNGSAHHIPVICISFAILIFLLAFLILFLTGTYVRHRETKLAAQFDEE